MIKKALEGKPLTQYTRSGRISIAYQVFGKGQMDLVYVPGWVSNIDLMWANPQLARFFSALGEHVRVILFDKRGTGLSDRVTELSTLEDRMDDIRAVMDAVQSERAMLFGHSEGGSVCALFAATYPQRTIYLITFGVFARRRRSSEYPWAPSDEARAQVYRMIEASWGTAEMDLASLAPSMAQDKIFMEWLASYFRSGASPSAALVLTKINTDVDIIDILPTINVPTLLLYRTDDIDVRVEEGRFIAAKIKNSHLVEFPGSDHLFWAGDSKAILDEIVSFISGGPNRQIFRRVLATILKVRISQSTTKKGGRELPGRNFPSDLIENILVDKVKQYRGSVAKKENAMERTATFDGPSKAVHCAIEIKAAIEQLGLYAVLGIHIGECLRSGGQLVSGAAVAVVEQLIGSGGAGEILITNTVQSLLSGAGLEFRDHGHLNTAEGRLIQTLVLQEGSEEVAGMSSKSLIDFLSTSPARNHSFLENVLQSIEEHLDDEKYSIQTLCQEAGVSERHLQRKLKSITNKSPIQLIRSVRLHRAKEMIIQGHSTISETAFATGFGSVSYFTKCFRKEFGRTPSELDTL